LRYLLRPEYDSRINKIVAHEIHTYYRVTAHWSSEWVRISFCAFNIIIFIFSPNIRKSLEPTMPLQSNQAGSVITMDSTIATPTKPRDNDGTQPTPSPEQGDMEEPSLHSEREPFRGSTGKGERSSFVLMRKSTLIFLGFLLLVFVIAFGYFFSEWMYERDLNNANGDKANCFLEDEIECPFTQDDMENLSAEIDRLEDMNKQLSNQLDEYEDLNDRLNDSVEGERRDLYCVFRRHCMKPMFVHLTSVLLLFIRIETPKWHTQRVQRSL
jgi:hypothetical protein